MYHMFWLSQFLLSLELISLPCQLVPKLSVHPTLPLLSWASTDETKQSHHLNHKQG